MKAWMIRTLVPLIVGAAITLGAKYGLHVDSATAAIVATTVVTAAYATVARLIETRYPRVGKVLMSAGLTSAKPSYMPLPADKQKI